MSIQLPISLQRTGSLDTYLSYVNSLPLLDESKKKTYLLTINKMVI